MKCLKYGLSAFAMLVLTACAGTNFQKPADQSWTLGKTTKGEILQKMGSPVRTGVVTKNDQQLDQIVYVYAEGVSGSAAYPGVNPARSLTYSFTGNTLAGQEFISSFKVDATDWDESKVPQILKGQSTRAEVISLLGKPSGEVIYPIIKNKDEQALVYAYAQAKGTVFNMSFYNKLLIVSFNAQNVVSDLEFVSNGNK